MSLENMFIDDFYVSHGKDKSLQEHLDCYRLVNEQYENLPTSLKSKTTKCKIFKTLIFNNNANFLYRKRNDSSNLLVNYWLGNIRKISSIYGACNSIPVFEGITKDFVREIIKLSVDVERLLEIGTILEQKGIILIIENAIAGLKADGAVFLNENGHAVIALSLRFNRLDNFWFTLVHELSHLILHSDQLNEPIIDDFENEPSELIEKQADKLTKDLLIPRHIWRNCACKYNSREDVLLDFSKKNNLHPAIPAGLLRYELNDYSIYSKIINSVDTREIFSK